MSVALALLLRLPFPLYAMIAAVIVTDLSSAQTRRLAIPRITGTLIGGAVGATLLPLLGGGPVPLGVGIAAAMLSCHLLRVPDAARLSGYVCGLILLEHRSHAWMYSMLRLVETMIGVGVAIAISLVPTLIRTSDDKPSSSSSSESA